MKKIFINILFATTLMACQSSEKQISENNEPETKQVEILAHLEQAHHKEQWYKNEMVSFDLKLKFGGKQRFEGRLFMTPEGGLVRMEDSSKVMIWDGQEAWISPQDSEYGKARFDLLTWSYFFAAPYKFSDPGTQISAIEERPLAGRSYPSFKLTFGEEVGDSPDDWYIVYQDREAKLLSAMAYIVTYSESQAEAEKDPHLITYSNYQNFESFPVATDWTFWTWNEKGETKKMLGQAMISNFKIGTLKADLFVPDSSFRVAEK